MKPRLLVLLGTLLCPVLAGAQVRSPPQAWPSQGDFSQGDFDDHRLWLGLGIGGGSITSTAPAPSADRDSIAASIDVGVRITPEWGVGLEFGVVSPTSGCDGQGCAPVLPGFAPNFTRWFLLGEYRPGGAGMRIRAGAGLSSMCYRFYETDHLSTWEIIGTALLGGDVDSDSGRGTGCDRLRTFGAAVSVGYQWWLGEDAPVSLGLQLRGETAKFAASSKARTPQFRHSAVMMQLQFIFN
jgi:hypothetical protein